MKKVLSIILSILSVSLLLSWEWPWERSFININQALPDYTLKDFNNQEVNTYDFLNNDGPVLLYFGTTTHHFSGKTIRYLDEMHHKYSDRGFKVVVVVSNAHPKIYSRIRKKMKDGVINHLPEANILKDSDHYLIKSILSKGRRGRISGLVFVNKDGLIVHKEKISRERTTTGWEEIIKIEKLDIKILNLIEGRDIQFLIPIS